MGKGGGWGKSLEVSPGEASLHEKGWTNEAEGLLYFWQMNYGGRPFGRDLVGLEDQLT